MASEKNPLEQYLEEKKAGWGQDFLHGARDAFKPNFAGEAGRNIALGGAAALGAGAVAGGTMLAGRIYDAATKSQDFRTMLEEPTNVDIVQEHRENPQLVNRMFSTLRNVNPQFTKDPIVSGSYVRRMLAEPLGAGGIAVEALQHREQGGGGVAQAMGRAALGSKKK